jgi:hypothetical protein
MSQPPSSPQVYGSTFQKKAEIRYIIIIDFLIDRYETVVLVDIVLAESLLSPMGLQINPLGGT